MENIKTEAKFPLDGYGYTAEMYKKNPALVTHKYIAQSFADGIDKMLGDILTVIDCVGLPDKQYKAIKDQITKAYYNRYSSTADNLINVSFAAGFSSKFAESLAMICPEYNTRTASFSLDKPMEEQI